MSVFELALLIGAFIAAAASRFELRVVLWIAAGVADYVVSSAYYALGLPFHPFFTAMADCSVCLAIYFLARYRWELWLWRAFQLSVAVSILQMLRLLPGAYAYALMLEICNWLAIFVLMGKGLLEALHYGFGDLDRHSAWGLPGAMRAVRAPRKEAPFHKVSR